MLALLALNAALFLLYVLTGIRIDRANVADRLRRRGGDSDAASSDSDS